jgi:hypothetical protein
MHKITIGFIDGFSNYDDRRTEANVPLLNPSGWKISLQIAVLRTSGFP